MGLPRRKALSSTETVRTRARLLFCYLSLRPLMQPLAEKVPRISVRKLFKRTEYFVACTSIEADALKGERVEIGAMTAFRHGFGFRARKQSRAKTSAPQMRTDPKSRDVEPPPINLAIDSAHKRTAQISCDHAKVLDLSIAGTLGI